MLRKYMRSCSTRLFRLLHEHAVFAGVVALFHLQFGQEGVEGLAAGDVSSAARTAVSRLARTVALFGVRANRAPRPVVSRCWASFTSMRDCMTNQQSSPEATATKPGNRTQSMPSMGLMLTECPALSTRCQR